ncbi:hypothetical protein BGX34_000295, partial [Mortierella sp. NVP85]
MSPSDPAYQVTKDILYTMIAAGRFEPRPDPKVVLPWFSVPKPDGTVRPILDCRRINVFKKAPPISFPPMPKVMSSVPRRFRFALHYDIKNG